MPLNVRVLIIYNTNNKNRAVGDPSVWYRCYNIAEFLFNKKIHVDLIDQDSIQNVIDELDLYTHAIFFRPSQSVELVQAIDCLLDNKIKCYASYDDLIFDPNTFAISSSLKSNAPITSVQSRYKNWANAFEMFDRYIVTSPYLANYIKKIKENSNTYIIENWMPPRIYSGINNDQLLDSSLYEDGYKIIGYFGGGLSHLEDIVSIQGELLELCQKGRYKIVMPDVIFENLGGDLRKYIINYPRKTYRGMLKLASHCDVMIAPLILDQNSNAKSAIKFIESALVNKPCVATYIDSFEPYMEFEGLITPDNGWIEAIRYASELHLDLKHKENVIQTLDKRLDVEWTNLFSA